MAHEIGLKNLSVRFGRKLALGEVTTTIVSGEVTGLVGRNGAGKTTLLRVAAGRELRYRGSVRIDTMPATTPGLVYLASDTFAWAADQTIATMAGHAARLHAGFSSNALDDYLTRFGLSPQSRIGSLSRGQASAARCAIALATRAPVTLLDEPQLGMDAPSRELLTGLIVDELAELPRTLVISTHLIDETAPLFQHLLVLDAGRVVVNDEVDALLHRFVHVEGDADVLAGVDLHDTHQLGGRRSGILDRSRAAALPTGIKATPLQVQQLAGLLPHLTQGAPE